MCGFTLDDVVCERRGAHYCEPRADRAVAFFAELLVHTKGVWARKPFRLEAWQEDEIIRPLFGEVIWSPEFDRYVRRYRVAWVELARKNGKSELAAGVALLLLVGDDEESAEVYGAAKDTKQAGKVWEPAARMRQLSPVLSERLGVNKHSRRIFDERTGSYYEVITADAAGELGHNPHGFILDEVLAQRSGELWDAMRTAMGTRAQPLMMAITTAGNDPSGFAKSQHDEMARVLEDPARAPHVFVYMRNTPADADPWDEKNWRHANPALGAFLSVESLRQEALEARNDPARENAFRQYRLNQWVQQTTRYIPLDLWDANAGEIAPNPDWLIPKLQGRCWGGLDLSAKLDLTAWSLLFEDGWCWWRFWVPEAVVPTLDEHTGNQFSVWARDGWVTVTDGDVIDYERVYADIETDAERWPGIVSVTYDRWSAEPVRQEVERRTGLTLLESGTTYERMTAPMHELMRLLKGEELKHGANPVARWMADNLEAKSPRDDPDRVRPVKPERHRSGRRIDGMPTLIMAIDGRMRATPETIQRTPMVAVT